jgi:hypothetical protein
MAAAKTACQKLEQSPCRAGGVHGWTIGRRDEHAKVNGR